MGFDYVVDKKTGQGKIIEMCYGFDFDAIKECGGYWDRGLNWHDEPLDVQWEIIDNLLSGSQRGIHNENSSSRGHSTLWT